MGLWIRDVRTDHLDKLDEIVALWRPPDVLVTKPCPWPEAWRARVRRRFVVQILERPAMKPKRGRQVDAAAAHSRRTEWVVRRQHQHEFGVVPVVTGRQSQSAKDEELIIVIDPELVRAGEIADMLLPEQYGCATHVRLLSDEPAHR